MEDTFHITNGINHHDCKTLEEAYLLGQHYATELQGEITLYKNGAIYDRIAPKPRTSETQGEIPPLPLE